MNYYCVFYAQYTVQRKGKVISLSVQGEEQIRICIIKISWQPKLCSLFSSKIVADDGISKDVKRKGSQQKVKEKNSIRLLHSMKFIPPAEVSFSNYVSFSSNVLPIQSIFKSLLLFGRFSMRLFSANFFNDELEHFHYVFRTN